MYYDLLKKFVSFQSISTDPDFESQIDACAHWLLELFEFNNFTAELISGYGNPVVYAHYHEDDDYETILIYGHYDVQPANQDDGWNQDPFVLTQKDDRWMARGVVDNKGQVMIHMATIFELIKTGELKYNIKFLIEGDEETGGGDMKGLINDHKVLLDCDHIVVSDGEIIGNHTPTVVSSFRGGMNATLSLMTATTDLHSGIYGNIIPSASHIATQIVSMIYDDHNRITIPGWYEDLAEISVYERENNVTIPYNIEKLALVTGVKKMLCNENYDPATAVGLLPTIQCSGISSGYTNTGYKNIIPARAVVKFNFRFGIGQDPELKRQQFKQFLQNNLPDYVSRTLETSDPYPAIVIDTSSEFSNYVVTLLTQVYNKKVVYRNVGGAVPITGLFQEMLGVDVVVADLANEDCNMHGIHENFDQICIEKGLMLSKRLFGK